MARSSKILTCSILTKGISCIILSTAWLILSAEGGSPRSSWLLTMSRMGVRARLRGVPCCSPICSMSSRVRFWVCQRSVFRTRIFIENKSAYHSCDDTWEDWFPLARRCRPVDGGHAPVGKMVVLSGKTVSTENDKCNYKAYRHYVHEAPAQNVINIETT